MDNPENKSNSNAVVIQPKDRIDGKVLKTSLQGALVDIGSNLPSFIHISQVVKDNNPKLPVNSIEEVLKVGDQVTVWVKRIKKDRIELTMLEPLALEWREIKPEMTVKGKVIKLETFGAFVEIGAERPGLIHISELSHNYIRTPGEVVHEGDEVDVKVLEVDRRKKQIKLSLKALQEVAEVIEEEKPQRSSKKSKAKKDKEEVVADEVIPDPTFMEIALRQAMERAEKSNPRAAAAAAAKRAKDISEEQQDIIDRTLKNKINQD